MGPTVRANNYTLVWTCVWRCGGDRAGRVEWWIAQVTPIGGVVWEARRVVEREVRWEAGWGAQWGGRKWQCGRAAVFELIFQRQLAVGESARNPRGRHLDIPLPYCPLAHRGGALIRNETCCP